MSVYRTIGPTLVYLLSLQLVLCRVAALKSGPVHRPQCSLYFTFGPDQQKYSEKSENIICLDSYILNSLNCLNLIWLYISHCMTSLLNLKLQYDFLAFVASLFRVTEED